MNNTMDDNGKQYLFAYGITDGALDDMSEEERTEMIIDITEIKEAMLKNIPQKYQNNEGSQNKAKVSI